MTDTVEVIVGVIGKAHGIKGDVVVDVRTDEPDLRFSPGSELRREGSTENFEVARAKMVGGKLTVHLVGIDDRNRAEELRGVVLVADVAADELPSGDDEFYDRQLIGLAVHSPEGDVLGEISDVWHGPVQDVLVIEADPEDIWIPFVSELVERVDLETGVAYLTTSGYQTATAEPEEARD